MVDCICNDYLGAANVVLYNMVKVVQGEVSKRPESVFYSEIAIDLKVFV